MGARDHGTRTDGGLRAAHWGLPALAVVVYGPALFGYFEADDFIWLAHGQWADAWHAFHGSWGLGTAYRPLTRLSLVLDARMFGWNAWGWHAINIALHGIDGMLLALLAERAGLRRGAALAIGALFIVLPMDWENVDWISGRTGSLCLLFLLLGALSLERGLRFSPLWLAGAACAELAALFCYEPAIAAPIAAIPLLLLWHDRRRALIAIAVLLGGALTGWMCRSAALGSASVKIDVIGPLRAATIFDNVKGILWHAWKDFGTAASVLVAALLIAGLVRPASRRLVSVLILAGAALYLPFALVDGFTERFAYLSTVPVAAALVIAASSLSLGPAVLAVLMALCAWTSHAQARAFRNAGDLTRLILNEVASVPHDGRVLVIDGLPTHDGPYYLLWGDFEIAADMRRPEDAAYTAEYLDIHPELARSVMNGPVRFLHFDLRTRQLKDGPGVLPKRAGQDQPDRNRRG